MRKHTKFLQRAAAFLLALLLAIPTGYARAGERKLQTSSVLTDGLTYYNTITENASNRIESFSLERSPYSAAYPILLQGSGSVYGAASITKAVSYAQSLGYHVLGAVNTDFFATSTGIPLGIAIEEGVYKSSPSDESAMAIVNGQVMLVDSPQISLTLTNHTNGSQIQPHHLNKNRTATGGLYLLNHDFSPDSTRTSDQGWYVRMKLVDTMVQPGTVIRPTEPVNPVIPDIPAAPEDVTNITAAVENAAAGTDDTNTDETVDPAAPSDTDTPDSDSAAPVPPSTDETETSPAAPADPIPQPQEPADRHLLLGVNSTLALEVVEVLESDQPIAIGTDEYVLTASEASGYISVYQSFQVGDRVTLTTACTDAVLSAAQWAGGVGDVLVRGGDVTDSNKWTYAKSGRAPRTALGVKADGTLVVYAVDGRQSGYSMGLSELDLAQEMQALGCQWAVNLDGGGSTAIEIWVPGQTEIALQSKPSDGVQRKCATYLMLVTDDAGNGQPARLAMKEDNLVAFTGSRLTLPETAVLDSGLNILPVNAADLSVTSNGLGTIENGVYTAGASTGTDTLTLTSPMLGAVGTAQIHIVPTLTWLVVSRAGDSTALTDLIVKPGETVQMMVKGLYWGRAALRDWSAVTWTIEGGIGTIDENGLFTMNENGGSGSITAHAGGQSHTIQVTTPYIHDDVTKEHWAYPAVEYCYNHSVVNGISGTEFGAENLVNRCDFVLMLYRAAGSPQVETPCTFADVDAGAYYAAALAWAQNAGLTAGGDEWNFRPTEAATREEAFTILRKAMPLLGKQCPDGSLTLLDQFADWEQIADYAREPIATLVSQGIVNGKNTGIDPKGNLTRAEMATLLYKVLTYTPVIDVTDDPIDPTAPIDPVIPTDPIDPVDPDQSDLPDPVQDTLILDQTEVSLAAAEQIQLTASLLPAYEDAEIVWTSSDPAAAPVTQQGVVTNIHPSEEGTQVVITASWNELSASCTVQCQPATFIGTVVDADTGLNVRAAAGTDQPITGGLTNGSKVVVVAVTKSGWYHIHYLHKDGYAAEGYVSGEYLQLNRS